MRALLLFFLWEEDQSHVGEVTRDEHHESRQAPGTWVLARLRTSIADAPCSHPSPHSPPRGEISSVDAKLESPSIFLPQGPPSQGVSPRSTRRPPVSTASADPGLSLQRGLMASSVTLIDSRSNVLLPGPSADGRSVHHLRRGK